MHSCENDGWKDVSGLGPDEQRHRDVEVQGLCGV